MRCRDEFRHLDLEATFEHIYTTNLWGSAESVAGLGSAPAETRAVRAALVDLLNDLRIRTLIDAPRGDFGWLGQGELPNEDIQDGDWRMLNLERTPFFLGAPLVVLVEGCTEAGGAYADKSLGLWRVADLR